MPTAALIDTAELAALIDRGGIVLLDCRFDLASPEAGRRAYLAGHIPGARHADLNRDLSSTPTPASGRHPLPDPKRTRAWLRTLGVCSGVRVVAYDESNAAFAARAWWLLRWLGHREVSVLDGGLKSWIDRGGALEAGEPTPSAPRPVAENPCRDDDSRLERPVPDDWPVLADGPVLDDGVLDTSTLERALGDARVLLIDARAPERFAGSVEPIDPVAGHVPGAVNHPFQSNLDADGRFLSRRELERRWRARLAGRSAADVVMMCGSGVTACQNLLALEIAGLPGAKLYAGSWSEWIRDPSRAIARGA